MSALQITPRVLLVLTNQGTVGRSERPTGFDLSEAAHPHRVFADAGFEVTLASPAGGPAPVDPRSVGRGDAVAAAFAERFVRAGRIPDTEALGDVNAPTYDAVFFVGGHGAMWDFPENDDVAAVGEAIHDDGGVVAALCHGPAALVGMSDPDGDPFVAGRRLTAFSDAEEAAVEMAGVVPFSLESRLRALGATVLTAARMRPKVVVDERLVTGQNPASARATAEAVVQQLRAG
jgi:putative intracellular protease/amidase